MVTPLKNHPLPNVWLGTSVENQATADERIPHLLKCPAAVRFLSCEPLLDAIYLDDYLSQDGGCGCSNCEEGYTDHSSSDFIHWVITGGESGPGARPMHPDWARSLRDQCKVSGVPFFFKQWGRYAPGSKDGKGTIVLNDGGTEDYNMGPDVRLKYGSAKWACLKPEVMHATSKGNSGHLLDGREHQEWPRI
jgi:protein gp37